MESELKAEVIDFFEETYIETGYLYSGCHEPQRIRREFDLDYGEACDLLYDMAEDEEIPLRLRDCEATSFELTPERRAELIEEHGLDEKWEDEHPGLRPNEPEKGEVWSVLKEAGRDIEEPEDLPMMEKEIAGGAGGDIIVKRTTILVPLIPLGPEGVSIDSWVTYNLHRLGVPEGKLREKSALVKDAGNPLGDVLAYGRRVHLGGNIEREVRDER